MYQPLKYAIMIWYICTSFIQFFLFCKGDYRMKLSAPTNVTFLVALILAVLGLLAQLGLLAFLAPYAFWLVFVAAVLLLLGAYLKGM